MIQAIAHPTDFSETSLSAFKHALSLAVTLRCRLDILHVRFTHNPAPWQDFPEVRETLAAWGLLPAGAPHHAIHDRLGVTVRKIDIRAEDAIHGLAAFIADHRPDLVVAAAHHTTAVSRWTSVSERILHHTRLPTLLFGPRSRPFIADQSGALHLNTLLVPVTCKASSAHALATLGTLFEPLQMKRHVLHVGDAIAANDNADRIVHVQQGPVVETIVAMAETLQADIIAMPRAGPRGLLDALRGSTSTRVIERATCPVLALPN
ncbi:MAG: hypothetical protein B7Y80_19250 [Hyphomicrobium sp. 32-62-53]|nr:MAG: hypothetical protein B7Z29_17955 [Hyphomicrobium sp. 12-62-95]OYX97558.1 MAG: hypothetical protein B7Y80_19250 [Hyphomicrobium sp. 32-62-53]